MNQDFNQIRITASSRGIAEARSRAGQVDGASELWSPGTALKDIRQ